FCIPVPYTGIRICGRIVIDNLCSICDEIKMRRKVCFKTTVTPRQGGVISSQDQGYLTRVKGTKKVGILAVAGLRQTHGLQFACITLGSVGKLFIYLRGCSSVFGRTDPGQFSFCSLRAEDCVNGMVCRLSLDEFIFGISSENHCLNSLGRNTQLQSGIPVGNTFAGKSANVRKLRL